MSFSRKNRDLSVFEKKNEKKAENRDSKLNDISPKKSVDLLKKPRNPNTPFYFNIKIKRV